MTIETIGGSVVPKRMGVVAYDTGWPCLFSSPNPSPGFPPRIGVRGMLSIARMTNWEAGRKSCVVRTTMRVTSLLRPQLSRELLGIVSATNVSAWTAHALAWAAGVWLTFGPAYAGVSVTPVLRNESETPVLRWVWQRGYTVYRDADRGEWPVCDFLVACACRVNRYCAVGRPAYQQQPGQTQDTPLGSRCGTPWILCGSDPFCRCILPAGGARASLCSRH